MGSWTPCPASYQSGAPKTNRTSDLPLRRGLLYPLSYRGAAGKLWQGLRHELSKGHALRYYGLAAGGGPPETWRSMGLVRRARHENAQALDAFRKYLEAKPDADDAAMIRSYIDEARATCHRGSRPSGRC